MTHPKSESDPKVEDKTKWILRVVISTDTGCKVGQEFPIPDPSVFENEP